MGNLLGHIVGWMDIFAIIKCKEIIYNFLSDLSGENVMHK